MSQFESDPNFFQFSDTPEENNGIVLTACKICSRTFNPKSLERHEKACEKLNKMKNRTVFNSFLQRAKEINGIPVISRKKNFDEHLRNKAKYKEEHSIIKCEKKNIVNNELCPGKKTQLGYQQCPVCNRYFNQKAADRHISWCQEQQTRLPKTPPSSEALERLRARTKYRAPLPGKKSLTTNQRLVKSADSVRESSTLRTHSSPPISLHTSSTSNQGVPAKTPNLNGQKINTNCTLFAVTNQNNNVPLMEKNDYQLKNKKSVKFKDKFPTYDKEKNKNLDMLAALRLRLSELSTSDDFLEPALGEDGTLNVNNFQQFGLSTSLKNLKDPFSSDTEIHCSTSSSSNGSLPSVNYAASNERRLPRFCYNCGTKYPIVSAKYCCECGARRFVFGLNENQLLLCNDYQIA